MSMEFGAVITPDSITFTKLDGRSVTLGRAHRWWTEVREQIKKVQAALRSGDGAALVAKLRAQLDDYASPQQVIEAAGKGEVTVRDGVVYWKEEPVHGVIADRIIWMASEGFDAIPLMRFLERLMKNPSKRAVDQLYGFLDAHRMAITPEGYILAYKRVTGDFKDIYTKKFDNSPGKVVEMSRNRVDDEPSNLCSEGLHFCAQSYLPHYGTGPGNRIVIVKVDPEDVVSVPKDHDQAKVRCCRYVVLGEYEGTDKDDLLGRKPVMAEEDFTRSRSEQGRGEDVGCGDDDNHADDDNDDGDEDDEDDEDEGDGAEEGNEEAAAEAIERDAMLREAVWAVYHAAYWRADRDCDADALWTELRTAAQMAAVFTLPSPATLVMDGAGVIRETVSVGERLREAVRAVYYAAYWRADRDCDADALWKALRDAAGFPPGNKNWVLGDERKPEAPASDPAA